MKIEVRQGEMQQIVGAGKLQFVGAGRDDDLAGLRALHRLGVDRFQHVEGRLDSRAQFGDGRLLVFLDGRVLGSQPERRVLGVIAEALDLAD
jgi:hypothetical protein